MHDEFYIARNAALDQLLIRAELAGRINVRGDFAAALLFDHIGERGGNDAGDRVGLGVVCDADDQLAFFIRAGNRVQRLAGRAG